MEFCLILVDKAIVNFVGNNWYLELIGNFKDFQLMLLREASATGVGGIIYKDSFGMVINL